jgi:hypothetical protein
MSDRTDARSSSRVTMARAATSWREPRECTCALTRTAHAAGNGIARFSQGGRLKRARNRAGRRRRPCQVRGLVSLWPGGACAMPNTLQAFRASSPTLRGPRRPVTAHATVDPSEPAMRTSSAPELRRRDVRVRPRPGVPRPGLPCPRRRQRSKAAETAGAALGPAGPATGHNAARDRTPGHDDPAGHHDPAGNDAAGVNRRAAAAGVEQPGARNAIRRRQSATGRQAPGRPRRAADAAHGPSAAAIIGAAPKGEPAAPAHDRRASGEAGAAPRRCARPSPPLSRGPRRTRHITVADGCGAPAGRRGAAQTRCSGRHAQCTGGGASGR